MKYIFAVGIIIGVVILAYVIGRNNAEAPPQYVEQVVEIAEPKVEEPPQIVYPVPETPAPAIPEEVVEEPIAEIPAQEPAEIIPQPDPLPGLDDSDDFMQSNLLALFDSSYISKLINFESLIRNFVVTVDNLTTEKLPVKFRFVSPVEGKFMVLKDDPEADTAILDVENYARYEPYVKMSELLPLESLANFYFSSYPLFQQAYEELGYPDRYFNDRLVEVIDHLLATPAVSDPIALKQPKVFYTYDDPDLESRSAGQKILIRVGPDNSRRLKTRLSELRTLLVSGQR